MQIAAGGYYEFPAYLRRGGRAGSGPARTATRGLTSLVTEDPLYNPSGSGGGSGTVTSVTAADTSIVVSGTDTVAPEIATATLDVIATQHPPAASVPMNSQKLTGLASGSASGDSVAYGQLGSAAFQATSAFDAAGAAATAQSNAESASLALTGGTMSGAIAMGSPKVTGLTSGSAASDAAAFGQAPAGGTLPR